MDTARVIVPPLVTAYAIFVVMVVRALRRGPREPHVRVLTRREIVWTVAGGYLVFLAIVAVFHVGLAGEHGALRSAATGGAFLLVSATVVYALRLWSMRR
jgi:heme/copper-type cytochrome/quinol oxidase subunit 2